MKKKIMRLVFLLAVAMPVNVFAGTLDFKRNGKIVKSYSIEEIRGGKLGTIAATEIDVFNAWRAYNRIYAGFDFFKVRDQVYGKNWKKALAVKFIAQDGYLSHSKVKPMLKAASGKIGLIAYKEKDKDGFTLVKKGDKEIDPGPLYLVWSNFSEKDQATYADVLKWPYQLAAIDLVDKLD